MAKNYYLSEAQLTELAQNGQITVGGVTYTADVDAIYNTPAN